MENKDIAAIFKSPIEKLMSFIGSELQQAFSNNLLEYQVEEYKRNFYAKTLLHRAEPKPLSEFYQPLNIHQTDKNFKTKTISTQSVKKLFQSRNYITIIGSAGSGKSTILKYLFVNCFEEKYRIPIKIELRYLNEFKGDFNDYIFNVVFKFQKLGFSNTIIDRLLGTDNFLFFLDGYDEINSSLKSQVTKDIDSFITKYPKNKFVITSRPYTSIDLLPMFSNFYVSDLNENEIASFVKKQIPKEEKELAEKMIKAINKLENGSYKSFLSNPLLLSMFILTFQSYSDVPQKRSDFYNQVFETLFSVHDSMSKLAYVREKRCGLSKDQFEEVLRLFSFLSFFEEKFLFPSHYLNEKLLLIKEKKKSLQFDNTYFIDDMQVAIGILNKEGLDYTFPHRSLQEYFSASYIEKLGYENKLNIYKKLAKDVNENYYVLLSKDHFFSLLAELDYSNLCRHLTIPLLTRCHDELNELTVIDKKIAYRYYGQILLIYHILLFENLLDYSSLYEELFSSEVKYTLVGQSKLGKGIELPNHSLKDGILSNLNIEKMIEKIEDFRLYGKNIIVRVEQKLDEIDKSDEEIIKLV